MTIVVVTIAVIVIDVDVVVVVAIVYGWRALSAGADAHVSSRWAVVAVANRVPCGEGARGCGHRYRRRRRCRRRR